MKLLLVTDIHGEVNKLERIVEKEQFDAILCGGDLAEAPMGEEGEKVRDSNLEKYSSKLNQVLDVFEKKGVMAKSVPGNMDPEEECVRQLIERRMNIHKKIAAFEEFEVVGFGGGQTPFDTPFEPSGEEIKTAIETLHGRMKSDRKAAVIHMPPARTNLDQVDGDHVGSEEVRELIEEKDFELVLTGHIHESWGEHELSGTHVVNPGPVMEGRYGIAEFGEELEVELKQL
ncbi:MAG: metallophosphoesterase family protein [Nanohaloarchaea archaeon]|nr:metallophosphoesterase family protein [Candidatus Nanohaloarchaea archaeon]